ncbi:MAG: glycoside hydrolase family 2 protein, partial [Chloroflexi bacterium]|nr:glycoside hydrolase family 2 protein [Chloroflexota bacterium]
MNTKKTLNEHWRLQDFDPGAGEHARAFAVDYDDSAWLPAQVPGDVHNSLLADGRIPDPFYSTNVEQVQWVEEREWWYRTVFDHHPGSDQPDPRDYLMFYGLDTFATIYLNGECLGTHGNMFRLAGFEVTDRLREGSNVLAVRLDPVRQHIANRQQPEGQWGGYGIERVFVRKTQSQFSWDWAPRLVNAGIWRNVRVERFHTARIACPYVRTLHADTHSAAVMVQCDVQAWGDAAELAVSFSLKRSGKVFTTRVPISPAHDVQPDRFVPLGHHPTHFARGVLQLPEPALWWPHGYGEQALYDLDISLWRGDTRLDTFRDRVGLRTVQLDQSPDPAEIGTQFFTLIVNGVPIFAKGANWIPADLLNGRVNRARYAELLRLLVEANGNMLRVWGGGQYEQDDFYRLADDLGVMIWHDFMFACALYPDQDEQFTREVQIEAEYQVRRLRNRASVVLWVGNNENDWIEDQRHWQQPGRDFGGKHLYHQVLPEVVNRLDPSRPYWPSTPYGGNDHNSAESGDRHNWCAWHGQVQPRHFGDEPKRDWSPYGVSYRRYGDDKARFISEFGLHALPVFETLRRNVPETEHYFGSPGMLFRNKDNPKDKGNMLMQAHTGLPKDLLEYIDFSMICQAEGMQYAVEHYRRRKFHCSGTLIWQWNDCWPGLTWSLLDYYTFPKAAYFYVKRAFTPVIASFKDEPDGGVSLWLVNDTLVPVRETLTLTHGTFDSA